MRMQTNYVHWIHQEIRRDRENTLVMEVYSADATRLDMIGCNPFTTYITMRSLWKLITYRVKVDVDLRFAAEDGARDVVQYIDRRTGRSYDNG